MLREPIQSIVSFPFYRQVPQKSFGAAAGYIAYLGLIFSAAVVLAIFVHLHPKIDSAADWASAALPRIILEGGKLSSIPPGPREVRHPDIHELAIVIDVDRTEPVQSAEMADRKLMVYLTQNAVYVYDTKRLTAYDLTPAKTGGKRVEVGEEFYRAFARAAKLVLYPVAFASTWAFFFLWKHAAAAVYALLAFLMSSLMDAQMEFAVLYKLAIYAQTPVIALQIVSLFLPRIPYFSILALLVVGVYLWQAIRLIVTPPDPEPSQPLGA